MTSHCHEVVTTAHIVRDAVTLLTLLTFPTCLGRRLYGLACYKRTTLIKFSTGHLVIHILMPRTPLMM